LGLRGRGREEGVAQARPGGEGGGRAVQPDPKFKAPLPYVYILIDVQARVYI